jgi:predicted nucleic acid-binding protein
MSKTIILDSGPLGMVTNPRAKSEETNACKAWFADILQKGYTIVIPEIADYEVRRELIRTENLRSIAQLDQLEQTFVYLPITTEMMLQAARLWAIARQTGQPTADPKALDGDVILAAQVMLAGFDDQTIVATTNVSHIARFVPADDWPNIT